MLDHHLHFTEWLLSGHSYRPDWWSVADLVVLLKCSPLSTKKRGSSVTIGFLVTSINKAFFSDCLRLGGSQRLPVTDDGGHSVHCARQCTRIFFCTLPPHLCLDTIMSRRSSNNSLKLVA